MRFEEHLRQLITCYPVELRDPTCWDQTVKNIHAEAQYRAMMDAVEDYSRSLHAPRPRRDVRVLH